MTTVINTPGNTDNTNGDSGWAVAVIILLVVIGVGAYLWVNYYRTPTQPEGETNINVILPEIPANSSAN